MHSPPTKQGLYHPNQEHDACGMGFVVNLDGRKTHEIVQKGIQILINLTNNAIKFTERGHVSLEVAQRYVDARARTEIHIRDTGRGIPPEDKARLFQAFEQIENTTSRRHEGTGLGLYLSQKLSSLLGGTIMCDSEPGRGTTFTVVLPEASS